MVNVLGYSYNADNFCVDCTLDYLKNKYPSKDFDCVDIFESVDEGENPLHPIFDIDETLRDLVCGNIFHHLENDGEHYMIQECNYVDQNMFDDIFCEDSFCRIRVSYIDGKLSIYYVISEYIQSLESRENYDIWFNSGFLYRRVMRELSIIIPEEDFSWYIDSNRLIVEIQIMK